MVEEVHDGRRLVAEVERPRADRGPGGVRETTTRNGRREPADGGGDRDEGKDEIRFAGQAGIVSAGADED